jgi:hypothetical protein
MVVSRCPDNSCLHASTTKASEAHSQIIHRFPPFSSLFTLLYELYKYHNSMSPKLKSRHSFVQKQHTPAQSQFANVNIKDSSSRTRIQYRSHTLHYNTLQQAQPTQMSLQIRSCFRTADEIAEIQLWRPKGADKTSNPSGSVHRYRRSHKSIQRQCNSTWNKCTVKFSSISLRTSS